MAPTPLDSLYEAALIGTLPSSNEQIVPYAHGLTGVDLHVNDITTRGLWASIAGLGVIVLTVRLIRLWNHSFRLAVTIPSTREQHRYWARDSPLWSNIKKHLLQAPLIRSRHNKEIQLSSAISVGTPPSRLHTLLLGALVISNVVYCSLLDYGKMPKAALIAELRGRSGHLAVINMLALVLFARNNPLIPILTVSFDTFNLFYRWIGRIIILESVVYVIAWWVNNTNAVGYDGIMEVLMNDGFAQCGLAAISAMLVILFHSPSAIRHAFYETFLHTHQFLAIVALGAVAGHIQIHHLPQKPIIYTIVGIWASERFLRIVRLAYYNVSFRGLSKMHVEALDGGACRVTFDVRRPFVTPPGRHIYAYIPSISLWMSHPFSVAIATHFPTPSVFGNTGNCSEDMSKVPIHSVSCIIAARTGMTGKLYNRARTSPNGVYTCRAFIEGPYGSAELLDSYGTVLLIAGGVGITNQLSHMHHLIQGWAAGTNATQRLVLLWSVRSLEQLRWARPWLEQLSRMERDGRELQIVTHVTQLRKVEPAMESEEMQIRSGRAPIAKLVETQFEERIGAMTIGVCGPGALADDLETLVRDTKDGTELLSGSKSPVCSLYQLPHETNRARMPKRQLTTAYMSFSWSIGLLALISLRLVSAACFLPNSTNRNTPEKDRYRPSGAGSLVDDFQMCCRLVGVDSPDVPRKDGLCTSGSNVWRESCTDPTWASPSCVKLCVNGTDANGLQMKDNDEIITPCPDESYCCGSDNTACCNRGDGVWIRDGLPTKINPNSTQKASDAASTTAAAAISGVGAATTAPAPPDDTSPVSRSRGLAGGAIAGMVIGCLLGVAILGLAFWYLAKRKRQQCNTGDKIPLDDGAYGTEKEKGKARYSVGELHGCARPIHEMHASTPPMPELDASERRELAGSLPSREME
ncbi:MAG: hypothetical protein Q9172_004038 [Xanthocarpia lactea]